MKRTFRHFNQEDRDRLEALLDAGESQTEIAKILKVNKSTISREISKRKKANGVYEATRAQQKAYVKRHESKYQGMKVESNPALKTYIIDQLQQKRSPDEIAGRMRREHQPFEASKDAIYHWLYSSWGQRYCLYLCSRRYRKRKRNGKKTERIMIPDRVGIEARPLGARNRTRYKH